MAEYIKKDEVIGKFIEGDGDDKFTEGYNFAVNEYRDTIKNIPAADVQPVVHCKDCKYAQNPNDTMVYCTYFECGTMSQNDFCSQGEKL